MLGALQSPGWQQSPAASAGRFSAHVSCSTGKWQGLCVQLVDGADCSLRQIRSKQGKCFSG